MKKRHYANIICVSCTFEDHKTSFLIVVVTTYLYEADKCTKCGNLITSTVDK